MQLPIQSWLNASAKDYEIGRQLYDLHGKNDTLKRLFKCGPSEYNFIRMERELREIVNAARAEQAKEVKRFSKPLNEQVAFDRLPEVLRKEMVKKGQLYNKMAKAHRVIRNLPESAEYDEKRLGYAREIKKLEGEINRVWRWHDHFRDTGELPDELREDLGEPVKMKLGDFVARMKTLPTYITRYKKAMEKLNSGSDEYRKYELKLAGFEGELAGLKELLDEAVIVKKS